MIHSTHRFHGRSSLRFVYQQGRVVRGSQLSLRFVRNLRQQKYRAAVVVSRKVSKSAVVRNRIRRRVFEIVRRESGRLDAAYDLVFSAHSEQLAAASPAEVAGAVQELLQQARICQTTSPDHAIVKTKES